MKEYQELTPDAEVFARVWKRVMPDESVSPIVVHSPRRKNGPKPAAPLSDPPAGDRDHLRQLVEMLDDGLGQVDEIVRRQPGAYPLTDSMRKSAAQARAAWLLLTEQRWGPGRRQQRGRETLGQLLRRQYIWEVQLSQVCRELEQQVQAEDVREILPELEQASRRRRGMIRHLLAGT